jgi:hypothetical protein
MPPYDGGDFGGSGQGFKRRGGPGVQTIPNLPLQQQKVISIKNRMM